MAPIMKVLVGALTAAPWAAALGTSFGSGGRTVQSIQRQSSSSLAKRDVDPSTLYPAHNLSVPVDHFHNDSLYEPHSDGKFNLRYWFDASHYKPGGPVIVLQSGETSGEDRLPYLQKGLLAQLAQATNGIGVVLEHRYYGTSFPTPDISTKNLRFLTTAQALADEAYFAQNICFPGLEHLDLTSKSTAYIGYGGSYAGAFNAFLRVQYPDIFWGTISSSGVTKAIYDYWAYYEPVAQYGPPACIATQKTFTHVVDNIIIGKKDAKLTAMLKNAFGLGNLTYNDDFANELSSGVGNWQSLNWDPEVSSPEFYNFCNNISSTDVLYPATASKKQTAAHLITEGGYKADSALVNQMLNYIGYINLTLVSSWASSNETQGDYFSQHNEDQYQSTSYSAQGWRSWAYQYCTEWGFLQTGSGVPHNQLPLISRLIDLPYTSLVCKYAFNITSPPDTQSVNKYGGYDIAYDRLAIVDGQWDPWRPATPHAFGYGARPRKSTTDQPFILIDKAVHHWDENGLFPNETTAELPPKPVADAQKAEIKFVKAWMQEWKYKCAEEGKWWW